MQDQQEGIGRGSVAQVAIPVPLHQPFDYLIPARMAHLVQKGVRVVVPFGRRTLTGYVLDVIPIPLDPGFKLRPIRDVLESESLLIPQVLELVKWIADYYQSPVGEVCKAALPGGINVVGERTVSATALARQQPYPPTTVGGPNFDKLSVGMGALLERVLREDGAVAVKEVMAPPSGKGGRGRGGTVSELACLERLGLVDLGWRFPNPKVAPKREEWVHFVRSLEPQERLGPVQMAVLACVQEAGALPMTELVKRKIGGQPSVQVRALCKKGLLRVDGREVSRNPFADIPVQLDEPPTLTPDQDRVVRPMLAALETGVFAPYLLHGITGSGKTEIYLEVIRQALAKGKQAIVLVPEISLTPQLSGRFRARFGHDVAVLHSGLTPGERFDQWCRVKRGDVNIVVGARSAVFAPLPRVGVIVVDEEHDVSFKQEETPRYHARDMALVRGKACSALVILGSATPSLESLYNAKAGRYRRLVMGSRATGAKLPSIEVVDLRGKPKPGPDSSPLSPRLEEELKKTVEAGRQAILFLNRRGFNTMVLCRACGKQVTCPNCSISMTHHRVSGILRCHYCDYATPLSLNCPACGQDAIGLLGIGTQKVEEAVREAIPGVRVARMDRDSLGGKSPHDLVDAMRNGQIDVLVGTQMVAKGHDFPGVVLVGVVLADMGLGVPDFRAAERTFGLLTQVGGRAGRGKDPGLVIVQTYNPDHYVLHSALHQDHETFIETELELRQMQGFPPYGYLVGIRVEDEHESRGLKHITDLARFAEKILTEPGVPQVSLLGPAPAPLSRLRNRFRFQILLQSSRRSALRWLIKRLKPFTEEQGSRAKSSRVVVDVDPFNML